MLPRRAQFPCLRPPNRIPEPSPSLIQTLDARLPSRCSSCQYLAAIAAIDLLYNVVDSPVGTVPVTRVDPSLDMATAAWTDPAVGRGHGSPLVERLLYGAPDARGVGRGGFYDAERMAGVPVGVQVVGRAWADERVVEMMRALDDALGPRDVGRPLAWAGQRK